MEHVQPNTFRHPGDRGSTSEAWLAPIGAVPDPLGPVSCKVQTIAYGDILGAMPPSLGRFWKFHRYSRGFFISASFLPYQGLSLTKI